MKYGSLVIPYELRNNPKNGDFNFWNGESSLKLETGVLGKIADQKLSLWNPLKKSQSEKKTTNKTETKPMSTVLK